MRQEDWDSFRHQALSVLTPFCVAAGVWCLGATPKQAMGVALIVAAALALRGLLKIKPL